VNLKTKIRNVLKEAYGGFETRLEHQYEEKITETLATADYDKKEDWAIYHQVILELKHNLKDQLRVKELQYRLTENENPNHVCIEVLTPVRYRSKELNGLYNKILNFI
jgi:hypothetical protein